VTTMFPSFSGVPVDVIDEHWADMSGGAKGLYVVLCRLSDRCSSRRFKVNDGDLCKKAGIVPRTLFSARKELTKKGLITYKRHVYELCDATTGQPYSEDPKAKIPYKPKSTSPAEAPDVAASAETDFNFAWNVATQSTSQSATSTYDFDFSTL
jgi:hypothetical protein